MIDLVRAHAHLLVSAQALGLTTEAIQHEADLREVTRDLPPNANGEDAYTAAYLDAFEEIFGGDQE